MKTVCFVALLYLLLGSRLARADQAVHVQIMTVDMPTADAARLSGVLIAGAGRHDDLRALHAAAAALGIAVQVVPALQLTTRVGVTAHTDAQYWVPELEPTIKLDHDDRKRQTVPFGPDLTFFPWLNPDSSLDARIDYADMLPNPQRRPSEQPQQWFSFCLISNFRGMSGDTRFLDRIDLADKSTRLFYATVTMVRDGNPLFRPAADPQTVPGRVRLHFDYLDPLAIPTPRTSTSGSTEYVIGIGLSQQISTHKGPLFDALASDKRHNVTDRVVAGPTCTLRVAVPTVVDMMQPVPPGVAETLIGLNAIGERLTIAPTLLPDGTATLAVSRFTQFAADPDPKARWTRRPIDFQEQQDYPVGESGVIDLGSYTLPVGRERRVFVTVTLLPDQGDDTMLEAVPFHTQAFSETLHEMVR